MPEAEHRPITPAEREPELVLHDVIDGKISPAAARDDYGVMLMPETDSEPPRIDEPATYTLRQQRSAERPGPPAIIDRGEGFEKMLRGEFKPWTRSA